MKIEDLLDSGKRIYVIATGAGAGIQNKLWQVPGISKVLHGAEFPYASELTDELIGYKPNGYCSPTVAVELALKAYQKAWSPGVDAVGLGLSASVTSVVPHRGEHRVFVAVADNNGVKFSIHYLDKTTPSRYMDGRLADHFGISAILGDTKEMFDGEGVALASLLQRPLFKGGKRYGCPETGTFLCGAFNPPHDGHRWLAEKFKAIPSITLNHPHKPLVTSVQVMQRAKLLEDLSLLVTTGDQLFADKVKKFPNSTFVVGVDTLSRMLDPKWGPTPEEIFSVFRAYNAKFIVVDRVVDGQLMSMNEFDVPNDIFVRKTCPKKYLYTSSTAIREKQCQT